MKNALIAILSIALLISVVGNVLEFERYSSTRPLMRIGDQVVTRKEYQDRIDYLYGKTVLNKIAYEKLIAQAARKAGVPATSRDIDERIAQIERRNPQILDAARKDPQSMEMFRDDIAMDIAFENLRTLNVKVSNAEVENFYHKNAAEYALPAQIKTTLVVASNDVDAATARTLLAQGMKGSDIAQQPRLLVAGIRGYSLPPNMPAALKAQLNKAVFNLQEGAVTEVPVGKSFIILRADKRESPGLPSLDSIRPFVTRMCKLKKAEAPDITLARLYQDAHVRFEVDKYAPFFNDITAAAHRLDTPAAHPTGAGS